MCSSEWTAYIELQEPSGTFMLLQVVGAIVVLKHDQEHQVLIPVQIQRLQLLLPAGGGMQVAGSTWWSATKLDRLTALQSSCCAGGGTQVAGATRVVIHAAEDAEEVMRRAAAARACESTAMNAASSRSHSVLTLHIVGRHEASGDRVAGALNLVDLAGR